MNFYDEDPVGEFPRPIKDSGWRARPIQNPRWWFLEERPPHIAENGMTYCPWCAWILTTPNHDLVMCDAIADSSSRLHESTQGLSVWVP